MPAPRPFARPATTLAIALALAGIGCARSQAADPQPMSGVAITKVVDGLESPVCLTAPPGDSTRLFVVEQAGRIRIVRDGRVLPEPFLDIRDRVRAGGERGLLSVAFHPRYRDTGFLYVDYTDRQGDTRIERYRVSADPDRADPGSGILLLHIDQPYSNHNGGLVCFGPDGMLWIGMGDGGSGGDPQDRAENPDELLGKLLRIDVDHGTPYGIPRDNPFAANGAGRREIWACGLRNPWRFSFDPTQHQLWIGDVGQDQWEEVDVADARTPGLDFGWRRYEGSHPFKPRPGGARATMPLFDYPHSEGCSITGGMVYRGRAVPALVGWYAYADFCSGWIRFARAGRGGAVEQRRLEARRVGSIASFGTDASGELYVVTIEGAVWRMVAGD